MICEGLDCNYPLIFKTNVFKWGGGYESRYCDKCFNEIVERFTCYINDESCIFPAAYGSIIGPGAGLFWDHLGCMGNCKYCDDMMAKYWVDTVHLCNKHQHLLKEIEQEISKTQGQKLNGLL